MLCFGALQIAAAYICISMLTWVFHWQMANISMTHAVFTVTKIGSVLMIAWLMANTGIPLALAC